ncbi:MAG: hypothetical protein WBA12_06460, partial [Catalinimonas sp.]
MKNKYASYTPARACAFAAALLAAFAPAAFAANDSRILAVVGSEAATISSIKNDATITTPADGTKVWAFDLLDGVNNVDDADNLPTIYESIQITEGPTNEVDDWSSYIQDVAFFVDGNLRAGTVVVTANTITFTPSTPISVADGAVSFRTVEMYLTVKSSLGGTADNENFQFEIAAADVTVSGAGVSSQLASFVATSDGNANEVKVIATELTFVAASTFPVNNPISVTVVAEDANGNVDVDYTEDVTISLTGSPTGSNVDFNNGTLVAAVNGRANFSGIEVDETGAYTFGATDGTLSSTSAVLTATSTASLLFDDFNRADNNNVGSPIGQTDEYDEFEGGVGFSSRIEVANNRLVLNACPAGGSTPENRQEYIVYDAAGLYATTFADAPGTLEWRFNMQSSRTDGGQGGAANFGAAFVLGSSESNFRANSLTPSTTPAEGYAVIIGENGGTDPVRLVRFDDGLRNSTTDGSVSLDNVVASAEALNGAAASPFYSVRVQFDPCNNEWTLQVRNDGTSTFADPATITDGNVPSVTAIDGTYANDDLRYIGAAYKHGTGTACGDSAVFDNISIPTTNGQPRQYTWDGSQSFDYQNEDNWTPARECPRPTDILVVDGAMPAPLPLNTFGMNNVPSETIGRLIVQNGAIVSIIGTASGADTLLIQGATSVDLDVEAGSALFLQTPVAFVLQLDTNATASISGDIRVGNSSSPGTNYRLLAADTGAFVFETGARLVTDAGFAGNIFGTTGTGEVAIFRDGATYTSRSGGNPFGSIPTVAAPTPVVKVVFENNSNFVYEQSGAGAVAPSMATRKYGNFIVDLGTGNIAPTVRGGPNSPVVTILGDFVVESGIFRIAPNAVNNTQERLNMILKGDLAVETGATFQ